MTTGKVWHYSESESESSKPFGSTLKSNRGVQMKPHKRLFAWFQRYPICPPPPRCSRLVFWRWRMNHANWHAKNRPFYEVKVQENSKLVLVFWLGDKNCETKRQWLKSHWSENCASQTDVFNLNRSKTHSPLRRQRGLSEHLCGGARTWQVDGLSNLVAEQSQAHFL